MPHTKPAETILLSDHADYNVIFITVEVGLAYSQSDNLIIAALVTIVMVLCLNAWLGVANLMVF